ncbi:hypothetical protein DAPPUDRAFT_240475 [Daphnia pulex]|uniref:C-type lectin domain-containing protein n=1 Tax=Daphnia pulex TaxID=6669 RepID=E9GBN1_DAPPU|nr:hypothetical protein DAPPUDRAFT_240475 [Daphnia pulex]|eukprot:EFX83128.1 hypothetical protein DAPPUDRAFT_240475 [Daphnia pulex]
MDNNFENGMVKPWIDQSDPAVKWKIENRNSPWEPENKAPLPLSGSNCLRVDRGTSLAFGVAILRSPVFNTTNTFFSFSFWIRSKWPQFTNLELYLDKNGNEGLLLSLYEYSDVNNRDWRRSEVEITDDTNSNLTLVFYAYCGTAAEDAVTIDDLYFSTDAILTTVRPTASTTSSTKPNTLTSSSSSTNSTSSTIPITTSSTTTTNAISSITTDGEMTSETTDEMTETNQTPEPTRRTLTPSTVPETTRRTLTPTPGEIITTTYPTFPVTDPISTEESSSGTTELTTDSTLTTTLPEEKCPEFLQANSSVPCHTIGTQCYCFYNGSSQLDWTSADQICRDGSMTLLTIETLEEDQSIFDYVISSSKLVPNGLYWTAGKYSQDNDEWEWASNEPFEPFSYENWGVGEPSNATDEYCAYANFSPPQNFSAGYWYDDRCATPGFKFICEQND